MYRYAKGNACIILNVVVVNEITVRTESESQIWKVSYV